MHRRNRAIGTSRDPLPKDLANSGGKVKIQNGIRQETLTYRQDY